MSLRMERPDQDEEERKEEPESVRTGDTWTYSAWRWKFLGYAVSHIQPFRVGVPQPVHHRIILHDQRGSETRRTKFSDQYEEERKEEPESVITGDTWRCEPFALHLRSVDLFCMEGVPHPVHHTIDLQKADQRRSETRRTKFSDQDKEEWEEEPKCGRAGDTRTGPRSASRKPHALRSLITLPMGGNLSPAAHDIDNDTADQRGSETRRIEFSAWGDAPFSPKTWSAAAVWIMMALTVATSPLAGAECIGIEVKLDKGEAVLRCPLPVDVSDTGQGIIVKHFPETGSDPDMVMYCFGPTKEADEPECESSDGFSLVGQLTDQVLAKVPVSRLKDSGAYKCQLYPPGDHKYFTPCHIHRFSDNDEDQRSAVTPTTPVVPSTATDSSTLGQDPPDREAPPCGRQSDPVEMTGAILGLQIIIILLLAVNVLIIRRQKNQRAAGQRTALSPVVV